MLIKLEKLDDVEDFILSNLPNWRYTRGKGTTLVDREKHEVAENYEVIQICAPNSEEVYAEFWKGYFSYITEKCYAISKECSGEMNEIMNRIIEVNNKTQQIQKIVKIVNCFLGSDEFFKNVSCLISDSDIVQDREIWEINCSKFNIPSNQRISMWIKKYSKNIDEYILGYKIEESANGKVIKEEMAILS